MLVKKEIGEVKQVAGRIRHVSNAENFVPSMTSSQESATTAQRAQLVALLILLTCLSQFYRVSNSVIAPELSRDLGLTATHLGWAGGVFFLALLVMQIPVGLMFDRIGARRTVAGLSIVAVMGAVLLARAEGPASHLIARGIVGIGCAASFMSAVFLVARWFPPARLSQSLSWVFAASNVGTLIAATPLAWASATIGWRNGFLVLGGVTAVAAVLFYLLVRDTPPGTTPPDRPPRRQVMCCVVCCRSGRRRAWGRCWPCTRLPMRSC